MHILLWSFFIALGLNVLLFIPAFVYKTDKLTDLSYSLSFAVVVGCAYLLSSKQDTHLLALLLVFLWALRLGTFLFIRIQKMKRDKRFDGMRERFWAFLRFWVLQGVSVFVILLPVLFLMGAEKTEYNVYSFVGLLIAVAGLYLEATADLQKYRFTQSGSNKWIDTGVWRVSRHPNYLGEMLMWIGAYLVCYATLTQDQRLIGLISPLFIITLLLFVSGIPILEKGADKRWEEDKAYRAYKKQVPVLLPSFKSLRRLWT